MTEKPDLYLSLIKSPLMNDEQIKRVTKILTDWNPIGDRSRKILDETGYETEAVDILYHIESDLFFKKTKDTEKRVLRIVRELLNEAFSLSLTDKECKEHASAIHKIKNK